MTIFYSWENDRLTSTTKNFIGDALHKAIKELNRSHISTDRESEKMKLDRDTQGISGYPDIITEILKKIKNSDGFVADLTYSAKTGIAKGIPNPNVMLELGYAIFSLGDSRIITVMNAYYGGPTILPFDLAHRRWPIQYCLAPHASAEEKRRVKEELIKNFKIALLILFSLPEKDSLVPIRIDDSIGNIWNHILVPNIDDWSESYELEFGIQQVYYYKNPNLRIVLDLRPLSIVNANFISPWANCFLHKVATSYKARIFYSSTFINEIFMISVDGGDALIPQPMEDETGKKFRIPYLSYKIALLFDSEKTLDNHIDKANFCLSKQGMSLTIWPVQ